MNLRLGALAAAALVLVPGCNAIFGIDKPILRPEDSPGGADGSDGFEEGPEGLKGSESSGGSGSKEGDSTRKESETDKTSGGGGTGGKKTDADDEVELGGASHSGGGPDVAACEIDDDCLEGEQCQDKVCDPLSEPDEGCKAKELRCTQLSFEKCDGEGTWQEEECEFLCGDEGCYGECKPDSKSCDGSNNLELCSRLGKYETLTPCPGVCLFEGAAGGEAECVACLPGTEGCSAQNRSRLCSEQGDWVDVEDCSESEMTCAMSDGQSECAGPCSPGQSTCKKGDVFACVSGKWELSLSCLQPDYLCRNASCEVNNIYSVGEFATAAWEKSSAYFGTVYAVSLSVEVKSELVDFRYRTGEGSVSAVMALYGDDDSSGPGGLLVSSSVMPPGADPRSGLPQASYQLLPGEIYYVVITFDQNTEWLQKSGSSFSADGSYPVMPGSLVLPIDEPNTRPLFITVREIAQ